MSDEMAEFVAIGCLRELEAVGFSASSRGHAISFGPFLLQPAQRLLLEGDRPLRIGSRALDVLIVLIERAGELVSKDELMERVWPHTIVEQSNLKVNIAALRRSLRDGQGGNRYIVNVSGRGYCFVAPVAVAKGTRPAASLSRKRPQSNLPVRPKRLVGHGDIVNKLAKQLPHQRLLTICGAGGVGKTSVALELARTLLTAYEGGVWVVELSQLSDPHLVPGAVAAALDLQLRGGDLLSSLLPAIRDKQLLLVLDNCERVIEAAAAIVTAILRDAPRVQILCTSREPLRAEGEHVYRLQPLAIPPAGKPLTAAEALTFPAIQLFVERAAASLGEFKLRDADAPLVANTCAKVDGVPLAINFAAARLDAFGIRGLAVRLDDLLGFLASGCRTALPQHQTIRATLDWSYESLSNVERLVFQRLGIFANAFSLEAAGALVTSEEITTAEVADCIAGLVAKSLVMADIGASIVLYRLFETTRAYAREKLMESGESELIARRHAEYDMPCAKVQNRLRHNIGRHCH